MGFMKVGEVYHGNIEVIDLLPNNKVRVRFLATGYTREAFRTAVVANSIKDLYNPVIFNVGYIGEGKYTSKDWPYTIWKDMLDRVYNTSRPTYRATVDVSQQWHNYQNFAEWAIDTHPSTGTYELDKDLSGSSTYSEGTCNWLPQKINKLISTKRYNKASGLPTGVRVSGSKFTAYCVDSFGDTKYLGKYGTQEEAYLSYKEFKVSVLKEVANEYYNKGIITEQVRDLLFNYKIKEKNDPS